MKKFIAVLICLGIASPSWAAIIRVQHLTTDSTANANTVTLTVTALTAGNLIVVVGMGSGSDTVSSITDNGGTPNTYVQVTSARGLEAAGGRWCDIWYAKNSNGGATTVTLTVGATNTNRKIIMVWEVSGIDTTSPLDGNGTHVNDGAATTTPLGAAITTTNANDFLAAALRTAGTTSTEKDATYTLDNITTTGNGLSYAIVSAINTYTPQWNTTSAVFCACSAAFKDVQSTTVLASYVGPRFFYRR